MSIKKCKRLTHVHHAYIFELFLELQNLRGDAMITDASATRGTCNGEIVATDKNVGYSGIVLNMAWESEAGQAFLYFGYTFLTFGMRLSNARARYRWYEKIENFLSKNSRRPAFYSNANYQISWIIMKHTHPLDVIDCEDLIIERIEKSRQTFYRVA